MIKQLLSLLLFIFISTISAQQHKVNGSLHSIGADGLYKIKIPHLVRSYTHNDIRDFRIWDSKGAQVPYFIHTDDAETRISNFEEFKIISQTTIADTSSTYIFKNSKLKIEKAILLLSNYAGSKRFSLQGSNDQKQWFGLVNSQQLYNLTNPTSTSVYKIIKFPLSSYNYVKIIFDDRNSLPVNLLKIGTATTNIIKSKQDVIPAQTTTISQLKEEKKTKIHITFEHPEVINQVLFNITAPDLYNRTAIIYVLKEKKIKHEIHTYKQQLTSFTIHSNKEANFSLNSFFGKELFIEIENQDNPALEISSIEFLQEPLYVVADLKKKETYTISAGDHNLTAPQYDIAYFRDRVSDNLSVSEITSITLVEETDKEKVTLSIWQQPWFMWICIGFAAILVTYFASGLLKDMRKDDT
ncbi:hypothetical protein GCM10022393_17760 [Aquimarina addita]|uniref:DUF3999 family protein n=1 Tax=Aquimarina addita TaxID=870485 RepID=A0ABP6UHR2_9FLAO